MPWNEQYKMQTAQYETVKYEIVQEGNKAVVYSVVQTKFGGTVRNYVATCASDEQAAACIDRIK